MKQRDVWSSRYCTWSLPVRLLIMIRDYKICMISKCNAYKIDSEITIVTFVLNSIFPLNEHQYFSDHSLQYCSTFPYLLYIIPLLLIIVYNNLGLFRADGTINGERRNGKNLEESHRCQNRDTESYVQFVLEPRRTWLDDLADKILIDPIRTLFCKVTAERNVKNRPTLTIILRSLNTLKLMWTFHKINKTFRGLWV
jgi:hypothetical protein